MCFSDFFYRTFPSEEQTPRLQELSQKLRIWEQERKTKQGFSLVNFVYFLERRRSESLNVSLAFFQSL